MSAPPTNPPTSVWMDYVEVLGGHWITKRWAVTTKAGAQLGVVAFYPKWRQFTFQPFTRSAPIFDVKCLRDLTDFVAWANSRRTVERAERVILAGARK